MIALNTAKGIVEVNSWQEIEDRPHFRRDIDPTTVELKEIIGSYQFDVDVHCGLTTCHQPHKRGYIVMTKSGLETNIGKDCGKNYFAVDFVGMKVKFDRDVKISNQRNNVKKVKEMALDFLTTVHELRKQPKGADWIYQRIVKLRNRSDVGESASGEFRKMIKERRKELLVSRRATKEETEEAFIIDPSLKAKLNGQPYFITVVVGSINHLEAMYAENDLKELLIRDVEKTLNALISADLEKIKDRDLSNLSKNASTVESKIQKAKNIIDTARKFLTKDNLSPMAEWVEITATENKAKPFRDFLEIV